MQDIAGRFCSFLSSLGTSQLVHTTISIQKYEMMMKQEEEEEEAAAAAPQTDQGTQQGHLS